MSNTTINAQVWKVGTLSIGGSGSYDREGNDVSGAYDSYKITSAESLHAIGSSHSHVARPNGSTVSGDRYTLRMAQNDFKGAAA